MTDDEEIIKKARYYNDHCKDPKKVFWNLEIGYKYKMSNFQAACGLAQLARVKELIAKKIKIFQWYKKYLGGVPGITLNQESSNGSPSTSHVYRQAGSGTKHTYWMVTAVLDKKIINGLTKEELMKRLEEKGIQARPFFYPLSTVPAISASADTPVAYDISPRAINLPCGMKITEEEVEYVSKTLKVILGL